MSSLDLYWEQLANDRRNAPAKNPRDVFVDVVSLSHEKCSVPIQGALAYATRENFLGRIVQGYRSEATTLCLSGKKVATALCEVQNQLKAQKLGLIILDAFRPLRAIRDFAAWMVQPIANAYEAERKKVHYPHLEKSDLPRLGYVGTEISRHCFGNAVDVSLIDLTTGKPIDMGSVFDYFGIASHHPEASAEMIGDKAFHYRNQLTIAMESRGFISNPTEYWHFDFKELEMSEPADFEITLNWKG